MSVRPREDLTHPIVLVLVLIDLFYGRIMYGLFFCDFNAASNRANLMGM